MADENKAEIVRTPTRASGGLTAEEREKMKAYTEMWVKRILRTDPIIPEKIIPAIKELYKVSGLKEPRVVVVPSPRVMAIAGGIASGIWWLKKNPDNKIFNLGATAVRFAADSPSSSATDIDTRRVSMKATQAATDIPTDSETWDATRNATLNTTVAATDASVRDTVSDTVSNAIHLVFDAVVGGTQDHVESDVVDVATEDAVNAAVYAAVEEPIREAITKSTQVDSIPSEDASRLTKFFLACIKRWEYAYQGGNMWGSYDCYLSAARDILGLRLPQYEKYAAWEQCAIEGSYRWMHDEFCMVSDFPLYIHQDDQYRPHCENGPSHAWRDGWKLYYWHGVAVTEQLIMHPETITIEQIAKEENQETRRAMIERIGWEQFIKIADAKIIHSDVLGSNFPTVPVSELVTDGQRFVYDYRKGVETAELLEVDKVHDFDNNPLKFVRVTDPSTGRQYIIRVNSRITGAYEGVASTFTDADGKPMTEEAYKNNIFIRQGDVFLDPLKGGPEKQQHS